jgi:hypothetical protein
MSRWLFGLMSLFIVMSPVFAQAPEDDLVLSDVQIESQVDAFGTLRQTATGVLENRGTQAYADVILTGEVIDEAGSVIGEAYGNLVDVCGTPLSDAMQPGQMRRFSAPLDLFEDRVPLDVTFLIEATATAPEGESDLMNLGVMQITTEEVVRVEWEDDATFRYGVGCPTDVFTHYNWYRYSLSDEESAPIEHPSTEIVTPEFIEITGIPLITQTQGQERDESLFDRSMLTFSPDGVRAIFQNDLHDLYSIEPDGSFRRRVQSGLYQHTLQGYLFTPQAMFLAYYYGAYGDPVRYIVATVRGGAVSLGVNEVTPSVTVPGLTNDGQRVIISGTFPVEGEDVTGYFWQRVRSASRELLFETNVLPGNNYPAPVFYRKYNGTRYIYIIRPINNQPTLQCFHYETKTLTTLTTVPLDLTDSDRAGAWISPDGQTVALAAIGAHGGLWQIDLSALPACEADAS